MASSDERGGGRMWIYVVSEGTATPSIDRVRTNGFSFAGEPAGRLGDSDAAIIVVGALTGVSLAGFAAAMESGVAGTGRIRIDLSRTTHWSLLSQAMVLNAEHRMRRQGRAIVIHAPSALVRGDPDRFGIFSRLELSPVPVGRGPGEPQERHERPSRT